METTDTCRLRFLAHSMETTDTCSLSTKSRQSVGSMFPCRLPRVAHDYQGRVSAVQDLGTSPASTSVERRRGCRMFTAIVSIAGLIASAYLGRRELTRRKESGDRSGMGWGTTWAVGSSPVARNRVIAPAWAGASRSASCRPLPSRWAFSAWRPTTSSLPWPSGAHPSQGIG